MCYEQIKQKLQVVIAHCSMHLTMHALINISLLFS